MRCVLDAARLTAAAVAVLVTGMVFATAAVAAPGPGVTFLLHNVPGHHVGTWTSSGAFGQSAGTWDSVGDFCVGGQSSPTFTCHFPDLVLTADAGVIRMQAESRFDYLNGTHGCVFAETGTWRIESATGAFVGAQASGTIAATLDFCSTALTTLSLSGQALPGP